MASPKNNTKVRRFPPEYKQKTSFNTHGEIILTYIKKSHSFVCLLRQNSYNMLANGATRRFPPYHFSRHTAVLFSIKAKK